MTYLEFFEALVGCAQEYVTEEVVNDPNTPRSSPTIGQNSAAGSRLPSNLQGQDLSAREGEDRTATPFSAEVAFLIFFED